MNNMQKFTARRDAFSQAIRLATNKNGAGAVQEQFGLSSVRAKALVCELDDIGKVVGLAVTVKWLSTEDATFQAYNAKRQDVTGDMLVDPLAFGNPVDRSHPAYREIVADYLSWGLKLSKSFKLYARKKSPGETVSKVDEDGLATGGMDEIIRHLVGLANALPAAARAVVVQQLGA